MRVLRGTPTGVAWTTSDNVVDKFRAIHGDKNDYSKVVYIGRFKPVTIICKKHNYEFSQIPGNHLGGKGCQLCAKEARAAGRTINPEDFFKRCAVKHNNKYDYSKSIYTNGSGIIKIQCPIHGEFEQRAVYHLHGSGCHKCGVKNDRRIANRTTENFIKEARLVHGDRYDYTQTQFVNTLTPININCPIHGPFFQIPKLHLKGSHCRECSDIGVRVTFEDYVSRVRKIHGDKYQYSPEGYTGINGMVKITCPVHGEFTQLGSGHLKHGCSKCHFSSKRHSNEKIINDLIKIHGDKYTYDKVNYCGNTDMLTITCKKHGDFAIVAYDATRGRGCQVCSLGKGEYKLYNILKDMNLSFVMQFKYPDSSFRYDFYLDKLDIIIEYDGEIHYINTNGWGNKTLEEIQANDILKDKFVLEKGSSMIRIPYTEYINMEEYFKDKLRLFIKYFRNGEYFKDFKSYTEYFNIAGSANPDEHTQYLF